MPLAMHSDNFPTFGMFTTTRSEKTQDFTQAIAQLAKEESPYAFTTS